MISKNKVLALTLAAVLTFGLAACAADPAPSTTDETSSTDSDQSRTPGDETDNTAGQVDENGYAIPGQVLDLQLGDSVAYYSYPKLTKDDVQRVTIHSFDYIDRDDLPANADMDRMVNGVLVLSLSWENVEGSVQSNQGYVIATLDSGEQGRPTAFMDDRLRNGRVDSGETRTGVFTIDIPRGKTTLTIVDYQEAPVARIQIDSSK